MWCTRQGQTAISIFVNLLCNGADLLAGGIDPHWVRAMNTSTQKFMRHVSRLVHDWYNEVCTTHGREKLLTPVALRAVLTRAFANLEGNMRRDVCSCAPRAWSITISDAHRELEDEWNARLDPIRLTGEIELVQMQESKRSPLCSTILTDSAPEAATISPDIADAIFSVLVQTKTELFR